MKTTIRPFWTVLCGYVIRYNRTTNRFHIDGINGTSFYSVAAAQEYILLTVQS